MWALAAYTPQSFGCCWRADPGNDDDDVCPCIEGQVLLFVLLLLLTMTMIICWLFVSSCHEHACDDDEDDGEGAD